MSQGPMFRDGAAFPFAVLREYDDWGTPSADLAAPPRRLWADDLGVAPPVVEIGIDRKRLRPHPSPAEHLRTGVDSWPPMTRRSLARARALFLLGEDPQKRLEARAVNTLAHQMSLVRHVLDEPKLTRVLVADEVGLGKTVEAGLIIRELLDQKPGLRVLYLAPARLVRNVRRELDRLSMPFRQWTAAERDARLDDPLVIASIHRAVHGGNSDQVLASGPWDVLIVDECHHLSDWAAGGGDPRENYKLVKGLVARLTDESRLLLLSGTPHQGHPSRFENLLALLLKNGEDRHHLQGRVIYRTKDDVTDWDGDPLFPRRQVNEPLVFEMSAQYRSWLESIHEYFRPQGDNEQSEARRRAGSWRRAQALQWAASSPQAGLGYLVRQGIRAGWDTSNAALRDGLAALRPYRLGPEDEPVQTLYQRILKEIRVQADDGTIEDLEESVVPPDQRSDVELESLITQGLHVAVEAGDEKWSFLREKVLDRSDGERAVLFAQPIETVTALRGYLRRTFGEEPAVVIGGQSDAERDSQIERFWQRKGPRFLVSSRAGGEGINLQVARRLVHIDVPWNPMELEQRVGRVHRFGSRQTILVDTLVARGSREEDAYRVARQKLQLVASTMVEPQRFEAIFSRVMCLIPPEQLQTLLANEGLGPISDADRDRLGELVQNGFHRWKSFHDRYAVEQERIKDLSPGLASWEDLFAFLSDFAGAKPVDGYKIQRFVVKDDDVVGEEQPARVLSLDGRTAYACGDYSGMPVFGPNEEKAGQVGLNLPEVSALLRRQVLHTEPTGAAHVRWPDNVRVPEDQAFPFGALLMLRQTLRTHQASWSEAGLSFHCWTVTRDGQLKEAVGMDKRRVIDGLLGGGVRTKPEDDAVLVEALVAAEASAASTLRAITSEERDAGIRYAVWPILAAVVGAPG